MKQKLQQNIDLTRIFGNLVSQEEAENFLRMDSAAYEKYCHFSQEHQMEILEFVMGSRGVKITYDVFFKKIMNPEEHPERLSDFISNVLGEKAEVVEVLPVEGVRLSETDSLVIVDIIVKLADGSLADVEMQKLGYAFPGQRTECYLSDMTMRQYNRLKAKNKKKFRFQDLQKIYMIVIMEKSSREFLVSSASYIHHRQVNFDTGVELDTLQNVTYICLDSFRNIIQNVGTELEAWLMFLSSNEPKDILEIVTAFPKFEELYHDMAQFRKNPGEVVAMYTDAFKEAELGTMEYMVDEMQKELDERKKELYESIKEINNNRKELNNRRIELSNSKKELSNSKKELSNSKKELSNSKKELSNSKKELSNSKKELSNSKKELNESKKIIGEKDAEIARLKALLENK